MSAALQCLHKFIDVPPRLLDGLAYPMYRCQNGCSSVINHRFVEDDHRPA